MDRVLCGPGFWRDGAVPSERGFQELGNGRGLVLYYASSGPGSIPPDTLTVSGDKATLHFRQGASVTDVLRFDRIAGAEMTPSETPRACP